MLDTICEFAVKEAEINGATEAEACAINNRESEVSIENNDIKQAKSHTMGGLGIRLFVNHRLGFSYANSLTKDSIRRSVLRALKVAPQVLQIDSMYCPVCPTLIYRNLNCSMKTRNRLP